MKKKCILARLTLINGICNKFMDNRIKEEKLPILLNHIPLFYILPEDGSPLIFNEISSTWGISKSSLSDIINKYEKMGYISKYSCCEDKRSIYISLKPDGIAIRNKLKIVEKEFLNQMLKDFDIKEKDGFEDNIDKALKNIEKMLD